MPANKPPAAEVRFSGPGCYRIEIEGPLGASWFGRFGDMRVSSPRSKRGSAVTVLEGRVKDQAELAGILNALHQLHLPLLAVERIEERTSAREDMAD